ncbi:MAG: HIT family protein [Deltaproteobacteria bacterium]|jgi:diadenosine tetraphosphate (Ap4A) HIT family hydrolase|nr:HIT family protein [Deltaproteobacteria bacterium]
MCLFCNFVAGTSPCFKIWESETHLAFLTIYPNTEGVTVVIPKKHLDSYVFKVSDQDMLDLVKAAKEVALLLDRKLGCGRTALVFEGLGVNHLHAKLYPLHGLKSDAFDAWSQGEDTAGTYFENYQGYITTKDCTLKTLAEIEKTAHKITD